MTKTLADLKRALTLGTQVTMITCQYPHRNLNVPRYVVKTQSNGVEFAVGKDDKRGSFFDFPKASLLDFKDDIFTIYTTGTRPLTEHEQHILDNRPSKRPENQKRVEIDMLSDGTSMYYADERHFKAHNAEYLRGHDTIKGLRYDYNTGMIKDDNLRGEELYSYKIN
jgi:hypothetical protein